MTEKHDIEILIAHELSHQWFGNLITPIWWSDAWLNEAFAAYFQYKALELVSNFYSNVNILDENIILFIIQLFLGLS